MAVDAPRWGISPRQSNQRSTRMRGTRLPRALAVAAVAVVTAGPPPGPAPLAAPPPPPPPTLLRSPPDGPGNWGAQVVGSSGIAGGPAGSLPAYVSVGSSSASHDLTTDDKGRLVSTALSELDNVSIGPRNEVHFSRLVTTAVAAGAGAENSKDGRADIRISDFYILDSQVELTRAGLRLANAAPSEQEAYDGAKVLLKKLKDRGITLQLPNFDTQLFKSPDHVTVDVPGLRVLFEQSVGNVAATFSNPLELGHSTAVVAALDAGHVDVKQNPNGSVTVDSTPS